MNVMMSFQPISGSILVTKVMANLPAAVGKVYLVGAGPGDPGLITLRGVECLQRADVVVYDYLVNPRILHNANPSAELLSLGNHRGNRLWQQDEINAYLVKNAKDGKNVVRLKGGDPAIFARGAEEVEALTTGGVPFEIVPGITAALAAGSYAGVPITHRDHASAVAIVTGQESPEKIGSALDFTALAQFPGTLVVYMGITTAKTWTSQLIAAGKAPDTPALIVRRCSFADQIKIECSLGDVTDILQQEPRIRPPAIVIVGNVAAFSSTLSWFDRRPLFGKTVMVTRPLHQSAKLASGFEELGAKVIFQPAIAIQRPTDSQPLDLAIRQLHEFDWIVFSSANGVHFFVERLRELNCDLRSLGSTKIAAIGPGTRDELSRYYLSTDRMPQEFRAEALAEELATGAEGKKFLLIRASRGREVLGRTLTAAGGTVRQVVAYQSNDVITANPEEAALLEEGKVDWVTVTSSAIAQSLEKLFGKNLRNARLASISPITSTTLRECGFEPDVEATEHTMQGVIDAVMATQKKTLKLPTTPNS